MSKNLKTAGIFSFIAILVLAVTAIGFDDNQPGMMHHKEMMGMMNMRGMMMRMNDMSQRAKSMMERMSSLMMDEEYKKDNMMKSHMEMMQGHMQNMLTYSRGVCYNTSRKK